MGSGTPCGGRGSAECCVRTQPSRVWRQGQLETQHWKSEVFHESMNSSGKGILSIKEESAKPLGMTQFLGLRLDKELAEYLKRRVGGGESG